MGLRIASRLEGISRKHPGYIGLRARYFVVYIRSWKSLISGDDDERMIAPHFWPYALRVKVARMVLFLGLRFQSKKRSSTGSLKGYLLLRVIDGFR
jgi:hypothetical protein